MKTISFVILFILGTFCAVNAQKLTIKPDLKQKVETAAKNLTTGETNALDPVALNAQVVWSADHSQLAIVMKVNIESQWHIYAYVPKTKPYVTSQLKLDLPQGILPINTWVKPASTPYSDGIYTYKGENIFVQYCKVGQFKDNTYITCGLYYQTCDAYKCFPPNEKYKKLGLTP